MKHKEFRSSEEIDWEEAKETLQELVSLVDWDEAERMVQTGIWKRNETEKLKRPSSMDWEEAHRMAEGGEWTKLFVNWGEFVLIVCWEKMHGPTVRQALAEQRIRQIPQDQKDLVLRLIEEGRDEEAFALSIAQYLEQYMLS